MNGIKCAAYHMIHWLSRLWSFFMRAMFYSVVVGWKKMFFFLPKKPKMFAGRWWLVCCFSCGKTWQTCIFWHVEIWAYFNFFQHVVGLVKLLCRPSPWNLNPLSYLPQGYWNHYASTFEGHRNYTESMILLHWEYHTILSSYVTARLQKNSNRQISVSPINNFGQQRINGAQRGPSFTTLWTYC